MDAENCRPIELGDTLSGMALKLRRRFQFIKRGRPLGSIIDIGMQAIASKCADPTYYAGSSDCSDLYSSPEDALNQMGCGPVDTSSFQAKIDDLSLNWTPTGVYVPDDIDSIVNRVMAMVNAQHNTVMSAQVSYDTPYFQSVGDAFGKIGQQAVNYLDAAHTARAAGKPVNAPDFKDWVVRSMQAILNGMRSLAAAACTKPFWLGALGTFDAVMADLWGAAKAVAGVAAELAKDAVRAVEEAIGFAAWLAKYAPLLFGGIVVGGAGYGFYRWNKRTRRFPSLIPPG